MDLDKIESDALKEIEANTERAANAFAEAIRPKIPRRSGVTAANIKVVKKGDEHRVVVPFPWPFIEYGFVHKGGKYIAPNPVVRSELALNGEKYTAIIAGKDNV